MTTGHLVFYGGLALLGLTILAAIIFLVKKPIYHPEDPIYETTGAGSTQHLRNGFPTEKETIRRGSSKRTESMETEAFDDEAGLLSHELGTNDDDTAALFQKAGTPPDSPDSLDGGGAI